LVVAGTVHGAYYEGMRAAKDVLDNRGNLTATSTTLRHVDLVDEGFLICFAMCVCVW
jgi:hypothetical protein